MYDARGKFCNLCNKQCSKDEHAAKAFKLEPGSTKDAKTRRAAFIDIRRSQRTMDEFAKWQLPERLQFDIKPP